MHGTARRATRCRHEVEAIADPRGEERARRAAMTLDAFFTEHYLPYVKPRKRSWQRDEELFRLRIRNALGTKRLTEVTRQPQVLHTAVLAEGLSPASADHHLKLLRQMLNLAVEWGLLEKNPVAGVP